LNDASGHARPARLLLRAGRAGVIATQSERFPGFPFASAVPYTLDAEGRPVFLVSDLAAHARNLAQDPRMSLCVHGLDVVAGGRVTLLGRACDADEDLSARERYCALFPEARDFGALGDFHFLRMQPEAGHYIGGFGDIRWFSSLHYLAPATGVQAREADIVEHMNADHRDALRHMAWHSLGREPAEVSMLTVDCDGLDLRADGRLLRVPFDEAALDADQVRQRLVQLARAATAQA
jgi:putative heme iron utilization protein